MSPTEMKARLEQFFPGAQCQVVDLTGTQDHYQVLVSSEVFKDLSRIARHQAVMKAFDDELKSGEVHALTIRTEIPK